jgi:hypothetical protein
MASRSIFPLDFQHLEDLIGGSLLLREQDFVKWAGMLSIAWGCLEQHQLMINGVSADFPYEILPNNRINPDSQLRCAPLPAGYAER